MNKRKFSKKPITTNRLHMEAGAAVCEVTRRLGISEAAALGKFCGTLLNDKSSEVKARAADWLSVRFGEKNMF